MPKLYLITDANLYPNFAELYTKIETDLIQNIAMLQYRHKTASFTQACEEAEQLKKLCVQYSVPLIINDRVEVAVEIGADGVHLGREDGEIQRARQILGKNRRIGVSCYGDLQRAETLLQAGADDLAFGAVFPSPTKPHAPMVTVEVLKKARQRFTHNLIAIGGINYQNICELNNQINFDYYAMISGLLKFKWT